MHNLVRQDVFSSVTNMLKSQQPNTAKVNYQFISQFRVDCYKGEGGFVRVGGSSQ